jgi:hypothetical protein
MRVQHGKPDADTAYNELPSCVDLQYSLELLAEVPSGLLEAGISAVRLQRTYLTTLPSYCCDRSAEPSEYVGGNGGLGRQVNSATTSRQSVMALIRFELRSDE